MSNPFPQLFFSGTTTPLDSFAFGSVLAGAAGAALAVDLINALGDAGAETAEQVTLDLQGRPAGSSDPFSSTYRPVAERWFEVRITAALNGAPAVSYPWRSFGRGRPFVVPAPIAALQGYTIELRAVVPPGEADLEGEFALVLTWQAHALPLDLGHHVAGLRGLLTGLGDGEASFLVRGFELSASGSPDSNIQVADGDAIVGGEPVTILAGAVATTAVDGNGDTLASGEAYPITLTLGPAGFGQTKGAKATAPLSSTAWLPVPAGELLLGKVARPESGGITADDITQGQEFGLFAMTGTGLTRTLGAGAALADDHFVTYQRPTSITWPPSAAAARVWLVGPSGALVVTPTAAPPAPRSLALWGAVTGSSDVTTLTDLRTYCRIRRAEVRLRFAAMLTVGAYVYATTPDEGEFILRVPGPVLATLDDLGTTATAGATVFDVEQWTGSAWASIFATSPDRRPSIAYNAADLGAYGYPVVTVLAPRTRLRAKVAALPTVVAAPSGAEVVISGEVR